MSSRLFGHRRRLVWLNSKSNNMKVKPLRTADDDEDDVSSNNSDGRLEDAAESSSSIIRHHADYFTAPTAFQQQQQLPVLPRAPQSGHIPSPASGVRSLSDDGVNHRILSSPLLRHRHHHNHQQQQYNRRQQSGGSSDLPNNVIQQLRQQQSQQRKWKNIMMIQGSHSLDDADIAAGAAQLRAMELLSTPSNPRHDATLGTGSSRSSSRACVTTSPSSRSLGSHTPTSVSRHLNYLDGVECDAQYEQSMERGDNDGKGSRNHYLYGGSEHDFLVLPPDNEEGEEDDDEYDDEDGRQQQEHLLHHNQPRDLHHPPYGLPSIEGSPDIVALNNRRQKMQLLSSADANGNVNNEDAQHYTALLPPKPPLFSCFEDTVATSQTNAATLTTTTATHSTTNTTSTNKFVVLGWDLTTYSRRSQFLISAGGTFLFSLIYGYLQELISVSLCNRKLGLFLALAQFTGYTILSYFFRR